MSREELERAKRLVESLDTEGQRAVLAWLRSRYPIHQMERDWQAPAEIILEAISRSDDISQRGVRGLIAEAAFECHILPLLSSGWRRNTVSKESAYDFCIEDAEGCVRIQVKLQRREKGVPKRWRLDSNYFVVETQRTRGGKSRTGAATRPYRFGDFDLLAVCMQPATDSWGYFRFTPQGWLLPHKQDDAALATLQPVSLGRGSTWSSDLEECVRWFRSGERRVVGTD